MKPMEAVVRDFDGIAEAIAADPGPDRWTRAERFLLAQVPSGARRALDVGCGDGAISRALAARGIATLGIDASPRMIELARARAAGNPLLSYRVADVIVEAPERGAYDVVVSVAMVHHAPLPEILGRLRDAVAPGGVLLVQDVMERHGVRHLPVNAVAWLARRLHRHRRRGLDALYAAHGAGEVYLDASVVEEVYRRYLPGVEVHHHLEWRYTAIWKA